MYRTLVRCKWGLSSVILGLIGAGGSFATIRTLSMNGKWFPESEFGHLLYSADVVVGLVVIVLAFMCALREKAPWLSLLALPLAWLCFLIAAD